MFARSLALLLALLTVGMAVPAVASADNEPVAPVVFPLNESDKPPPTYRLTPRGARLAADRHPEIRELRREHDGLRPGVQIPAEIDRRRPYEVTYSVEDKVLATAEVNGLTGRVYQVWTGPGADFPLARGMEPSLGFALNSPWIWFPLALLFLAPFVDPRRPFRLLHLDLLVLLSFGVSQFFFNRGEVDISVPLVYPLLVYLLVRLLLAGFRPRPRGEPLVPYFRASWLAVGLVVLVAFRLGLNLIDSEVIDVGLASVIGADRIAHGEELYVLNNMYGDTYGPIAYVAYIPFELVFPTDGVWGYTPAAHAAALTFDLATIVGLMLLGTRLRPGQEGRRIGLALGFAWAAYPFTTYALQVNTNDGLVAMLLVFTLLALRSPATRGALLGLSAAAKFAPLALAPLLATGTGEAPRSRSWPQFALSLAGVCVLAVFMYLPDGGLREFWDATLGYQMSRVSPFSLWSLHESLQWVQDLVTVAALLLAAAVAFVPGRRDLRTIAALGAAVLIAVQLPAIHWFYFYIVWFAPLALLAMFGGYRWVERPSRVPVGHMNESTLTHSG